MTRQWIGVPVECLCKQGGHLQGEHGEHHQELGSILNGNLESVWGHIEENQFYPSEMVSRHRKLANEIRRRGGIHTDGHKNKWDTFQAAVRDAVEEYPALFAGDPPTIDQKLENAIDLAARCEHCRTNLLDRGWEFAAVSMEEVDDSSIQDLMVIAKKEGWNEILHEGREMMQKRIDHE